MAVDDFDTSRMRECNECHRHDFDSGDWQFIGYDDLAELYICPDCVELASYCNDDFVTRSAEQRNDAETGIPAATNNSTMMECGNCGVPRFVHDGTLEKCPNCGDDEFDLSLMGDAP